jgi:hypothetical protein
MLLYLCKLGMTALTYALALLAVIGFLMVLLTYVVGRTRGLSSGDRKLGLWGLIFFLGGIVASILSAIGGYMIQERHDRELLDAAKSLVADCQQRQDVEPVPRPNKVLIIKNDQLHEKGTNALPENLQAGWNDDMLLLVLGDKRFFPGSSSTVVDVSVVRWPKKEAIGSYIVEIGFHPEEKAIAQWIQGLPARAHGDGSELRDKQRPAEKKD